MGLVLIRIDDRMIHGQVVEGWARSLKIEHILLANDEISCDEMKKMLCCMGVPNFIKLTIKDVKEAAAMVKNHCFDAERTLVLFAEPTDVLSFIDLGVKINSVNVGGIHHSEGKRQILKFVSVSPEDVSVFRRLADMGVEVEGRAVPTDDKIEIIHYL